MALVRELKELKLERDAPHDEVDCTYSIILGDQGKRYLQIDTYGSKRRQMPGKKSQSLRLSPEAIQQLRRVLADHF
jgi:hypothetical protein